MSFNQTSTQPEKVNLIRHGIAPSQDPARAGQFDWFGVYQLSPGQTFTVVIPKREPTDIEVDNAIRADYQKQRMFINREIRL